MKPFDFDQWALVAPNDDSGLGRMAQDIKAMLPMGRHLVTSTQRMSNRPLVEPRETWLDAACSVTDLAAQLAGLQGVICLERPNWHPELLPTVRRLGMHSVGVPMWEWFRGRSPQWRNCDLFACPNEVCLKVVRSYGFENAVLIPWVLDLARFPARVVRGPARHFVHNAGLIDPDDRKGTHEAIAAFQSVRQPDLRLTVRIQKGEALSPGDSRIHLFSGNLPNPAALYAEGDAFIQPSKLEGIGFMVLEAVASGLPVITLNHPPMNEWVRQPELLAQIRRLAYPAYSSAWIEHSRLRLPRIDDLARKILWAAEHDLEPISRANRAWAEETFDPACLREKWERALAELHRTPAGDPVELSAEPPPPCFSVSHRIRSKVTDLTGWRVPFFGTS